MDEYATEGDLSYLLGLIDELKEELRDVRAEEARQ
jgi:hypothetical protein